MECQISGQPVEVRSMFFGMSAHAAYPTRLAVDVFLRALHTLLIDPKRVHGKDIWRHLRQLDFVFSRLHPRSIKSFAKEVRGGKELMLVDAENFLVRSD